MNNQKTSEYYHNIEKYFAGKPELLKKLYTLDEKKQEVKQIMSQIDHLPSPIVITISGTSRAGKTTCINSLFDFFKKINLRTKCLEEPAGLIYSHLKNRSEK